MNSSCERLALCPCAMSEMPIASTVLMQHMTPLTRGGEYDSLVCTASYMPKPQDHINFASHTIEEQQSHDPLHCTRLSYTNLLNSAMCVHLCTPHVHLQYSTICTYVRMYRPAIAKMESHPQHCSCRTTGPYRTLQWVYFEISVLYIRTMYWNNETACTIPTWRVLSHSLTLQLR